MYTVMNVSTSAAAIIAGIMFQNNKVSIGNLYESLRTNVTSTLLFVI